MHHFNISLHFPINDYSIIPLFCFTVSLISLLSYDCNFPVFLIIFFTLVCLRLWCFFVFSIICFPVYFLVPIFLVFPIICFPVCLFEFVVRLSKLLQSLLFEFLRPDWPSNRQANQTYFLWIIFYIFFCFPYFNSYLYVLYFRFVYIG